MLRDSRNLGEKSGEFLVRSATASGFPCWRAWSEAFLGSKQFPCTFRRNIGISRDPAGKSRFRQIGSLRVAGGGSKARQEGQALIKHIKHYFFLFKRPRRPQLRFCLRRLRVPQKNGRKLAPNAAHRDIGFATKTILTRLWKMRGRAGIMFPGCFSPPANRLAGQALASRVAVLPAARCRFAPNDGRLKLQNPRNPMWSKAIASFLVFPNAIRSEQKKYIAPTKGLAVAGPGLAPIKRCQFIRRGVLTFQAGKSSLHGRAKDFGKGRAPRAVRVVGWCDRLKFLEAESSPLSGVL